MAPKVKPTNQRAAASEAVQEYPTVSAQREAEYLASRPYQVLKDTKGLSGMTADERAGYATYRFLETGVWRSFTEPQQKEFWKLVKEQHIPQPLPKPRDLGKDARGREIGTYSPEEYWAYKKRADELAWFRKESERFARARGRGEVELGDENPQVIEERNRRKIIGRLSGKAMGRYESDPVWDDVVPIPQVDGEGALAQIAYTEEYAEAMGYLRAVMASKEHSPRVLDLTEHIISLNAAHYTVWLYRATTILALNIPINEEIEWMNGVALENQKNYQIWTHRQTLIDHIYPSISSDPASTKELADSESAFMAEMFDEDAKNYHVWSHRQYIVRKLNLFDSEKELQSIESLLKKDVRNNSAWSHRFFLVFSNPAYTTPGSRATEHDARVPDEILDRELRFAEAATYEAPQNQSPWEYIRGVLKKGGRKLSSLESFAEEFVTFPEDREEQVKSSHALDFLADVWSEQGKIEKADRALRLLGDKYDRIRKNYWDWKIGLLKQEKSS